MVLTMAMPDELRRAQSLFSSGRMGEAIAFLRAAADDQAIDDPGAAARLRIEAVQMSLYDGGPERAVSVAEAALLQARGAGDTVEAMALIRLGDALTWAGRHAEAARQWEIAEAMPWAGDPALACERANAALRRGHLPRARELAYEAVVRARQAESHVDLIDALGIATMVEIHSGRLREALGTAEQSLSVSTDDDGLIRSAVLGLAAWVLALLGDTARCRMLIEEATTVNAELRVTAPGGFAAGFLALGEARYADAVHAFEAKTTELPLSPVAQALGIRPYVPALAEAYARSGREDDAAALLAAFFDAAIASGHPRHVAVAQRTRGVVHEDLEALGEALDAHRQWGNPFEEARTRLARGELLRRRRRRDEARADLRVAAARFEQVGAVSWHRRALIELRAAGDRRIAMAAATGSGPERLTEQEAAIVALVAEGLSNREIADRLFLSVKTVEGHLTTIYGKLGVRSRAQLIAAGSPRFDRQR